MFLLLVGACILTCYCRCCLVKRIFKWPTTATTATAMAILHTYNAQCYVIRSRWSSSTNEIMIFILLLVPVTTSSSSSPSSFSSPRCILSFECWLQSKCHNLSLIELFLQESLIDGAESNKQSCYCCRFLASRLATHVDVDVDVGITLGQPQLPDSALFVSLSLILLYMYSIEGNVDDEWNTSPQHCSFRVKQT